MREFCEPEIEIISFDIKDEISAIEWDSDNLGEWD